MTTKYLSFEYECVLQSFLPCPFIKTEHFLNTVACLNPAIYSSSLPPFINVGLGTPKLPFFNTFDMDLPVTTSSSSSKRQMFRAERKKITLIRSIPRKFSHQVLILLDPFMGGCIIARTSLLDPKQNFTAYYVIRSVVDRMMTFLQQLFPNQVLKKGSDILDVEELQHAEKFHLYKRGVGRNF